MSTALDLFTDAITSLGQLGIGQSLSPEEAAQAMRVCNRMLQKWSTQRLMLYTIGTRTYALIPLQQDYTVGPNSATFPDTRPVFIETALIQLPTSTEERPLNLLDKPKWGAIRDKLAQTSPTGAPTDVWPEYTFPNLTFHVWPRPFAVCQIKLGSWDLLQQFATIFDTVNFPPAYENAITVNLAMELSPYYDMPVSPALAQLAADGLLKIQGVNAQSIGGAIGDTRTLQNPNLDTPVPTGAPQQG